MHKSKTLYFIDKRSGLKNTSFSERVLEENCLVIKTGLRNQLLILGLTSGRKNLWS